MEKQPHFIWGKMRKFEILPLKPEELLAVYHEKFGSYEPFEEETIWEIAKLSRGIIRRFMKYIEVCDINHVMSGKAGFLNSATVQAAITLRQLTKDMELELSNIFRTSEKRYNAVRIISLLSQKGELNQKQIAIELGLSEPVTMRLLKKLFDYVNKRRGVKNEWLCSLK